MRETKLITEDYGAKYLCAPVTKTINLSNHDNGGKLMQPAGHEEGKQLHPYTKLATTSTTRQEEDEAGEEAVVHAESRPKTCSPRIRS